MKCGWCVSEVMLLLSGPRPGHRPWAPGCRSRGAGGRSRHTQPVPERWEMLWAQASGREDGCSEKSHFPRAAVQHFLPVSSFRGFLPKENKEESHFPRDSVHCLPHPTSLPKKSFAEQFAVGHMQRTTVPSLPWAHPTACPHLRHRQILTPLPFIFLSHRCPFLQNSHLTPISVPSAFTGAQGHSVVLLGASPGDTTAPRWLSQSTSNWGQ